MNGKLRARFFRIGAGKLRRRKFARGQTIYLTLGALVFIFLMTYAAFSVSQMTHNKTQAMNAADAGAYALATTVARDLNFMAYTNRAVVANHVAVGQFVSLGSLAHLINLAADDISILKNFGWVPYAGPYLRAIGEAFEYVAEIIEEFVKPALGYAVQGMNYMIEGISYMQEFATVMSVADMAKAEKVIKANDEDLEWAVSDGGGVLASASNVASLAETFFGDFTKRQDGDEALSRLRNVVRNSRDGFTYKREWADLPFVDEIFHGGTDLSTDNKTWLGVDGIEFEIPQPWPHDDIEVELWRAGAVAGDDSRPSDWEKLNHGNLSSGLQSSASSGRNLDKDTFDDAYDGLQPYWELSELKAGERPSPTYVVVVFKPIDNDSVPTANQTFQTNDADNPFHLKEGRANIYSVAAAQAFHRRPAAVDKDPTAGNLPNSLYKEGTYATLFSPYWQPRLTSLPAAVTAGLLFGMDK
jgi:hypothetical protein